MVCCEIALIWVEERGVEGDYDVDDEYSINYLVNLNKIVRVCSRMSKEGEIDRRDYAGCYQGNGGKNIPQLLVPIIGVYDHPFTPKAVSLTIMLLFVVWVPVSRCIVFIHRNLFHFRPEFSQIIEILRVC